MATIPTATSTPAPDLAQRAKGALERVCSGAGLDPASRYYGASFLDHVNDLEFRGLTGAQQSVDLYRQVLSDMIVTVEEQTVEGDRVTSRFVVAGTRYGRRVRFNGITLSRFEDGLIVEDWSVTDTLGMLRQLGVWRCIVVGVQTWRSVRATDPARATGPRSARAPDHEAVVERGEGGS